MSVTLESIKASMDKTCEAWEAKSAAFEEMRKRYDEEVKNLGVATKDTAAELEKMAQTILSLQQDFEGLKNSLAEAEANAQSGDPAAEDLEVASTPGQLFVKSAQYETLVENMGANGLTWRTGEVMVKSRSFARAVERKTFGNDSFLLGTNADGMAPEYFRPDSPETKKRMGFMLRGLMTTIDPGDVGSIRSRVEDAEYMLVAKLTEAIVASGSAGARTVKVDRVAGLTDEAPYNTFSMDNGTGAEDFTIDSITPDDPENDPAGPGTIVTTSTASIKAYSLGQLVTADQFAPTLEAQLKPKSLDKFSDVQVPIDKIVTWTDTSDEEMADNVRAQDLIDRRLTSKYGRQEDQYILQHPNRGFFNNSAIPSFNWSAQPTGTTKLDFIVRLCFQLSVAEHICTDILIHPSDVRDIVLQKGTDGHYVTWKMYTETGAMRIYGARVHMTTAVPSGKVLVGDFPESATLYIREDIGIKTGQPGNYFLENKHAILAEGRIGLNVDLPLGFAVGVFDSAP